MPKARPLPHQAIQQQRGFLGHLVIFDEEFLKLVDDEQMRGRLSPASRKPPISCTPAWRKRSPRNAHFGIQPLHDAQAELALAFDRDDPGVRQLVRDIRLELDPLLEVDQVQLDFVWAVAQGSIGDQGVQKRRLARAGLAGDQHVLRGPLAQAQMLQPRGAGAPKGTSMPRRLSDFQ